jgi:NADH-quinone oxidoreductase subunit N
VNDVQNTIAALLGSYRFLLPEIVLGVTACVIYVAGTFRAGRNLYGGLALLGLALATVALGQSATARASTEAVLRAGVYAGPVVNDALALLIKVIALGGGAVLVLLSWNELPESQVADWHACLLIILGGLCLTGAANDLVTMFLALELISIPTYIMLYLPRHDAPAQEAALKYFLLSVFSSALLLFGFSYLYGLAGTTNLPALFDTAQRTEARDVPAIAQVAVILVVAGLGFRITAVPFHFYAPDVYEGTATSMAALLAFVPKVAGFVALVRLLGFVLPAAPLPGEADLHRVGTALSQQTPILLWFLAAVTMSLGNVLALLQDNLKRLLAYSSVAHAGYMLIALAAAPYLRATGEGAPASAGPGGVESLLYYLVAYGAMTIGAFGVIAYLTSGERPVESVDDLAGLSSSHPGVALLMVLFLFSLIGIPLTAGFTGKLMVFFGAMSVPSEAHAELFRWLAVIGVLNAAVGAWYYLRIIAVMYLRTPVRPLEKRGAWPGLATLWICGLLTLGLSIPPGAQWLVGAARQATGQRAASRDVPAAAVTLAPAPPNVPE